MIEIKELQKKFGKFEVLKNINLSCKKGECIALIGPNGCGKTTLIKSVLGMVLPDSGTIHFNGNSVLGEYLYREKIGYMPQIGRYPDNMTIGQIIEMITKIRHYRNHFYARRESTFSSKSRRVKSNYWRRENLKSDC
jgi:Cu-processing system ATP-binding protein